MEKELKSNTSLAKFKYSSPTFTFSVTAAQKRRGLYALADNYAIILNHVKQLDAIAQRACYIIT